MKGRKCCWTCTARRVHCDRGLPTCKRCSRAGQECQGYEMRLSWPRNGDKRRTVTGHLPLEAICAKPETNLFFINTTWWDVESHSLLSLGIKAPFEAGPAQLRASHTDLTHYFYSSAYLSVVTFGVNPSQLRDVLLRMAMADDSATTLAVFYALLAFASLRLYGLDTQAIQLKVSAIHFLLISARKGTLSLTEAAQHVAASMLLGSFELLITPESPGEWVWFISGGLSIVEATLLTCESHQSDIGHLLDWLSYHALLSRFSIYNRCNMPSTFLKPYINYADPGGLLHSSLLTYRPTSPASSPTYVMLNLLSEIHVTLLNGWNNRIRNEEYHNRLEALEERIENLPIIPVSSSLDTLDAIAVQVYQMAARVYFERVSQSSWRLSTKLDSLIDNIFAGPLPSHACGHFFPVFILACEARTDERRAAILNLIDRTQESTQIRGIIRLRHTVQSIWVQQDLHADTDFAVPSEFHVSQVLSLQQWH